MSRFLPGLRAAVPPFAGVAGFPAMKSLVPAALASAIWYAFLATAGYQLAANWEAVKALVGEREPRAGDHRHRGDDGGCRVGLETDAEGDVASRDGRLSSPWP